MHYYMLLLLSVDFIERLTGVMTDELVAVSLNQTATKLFLIT